MQQEKQTLIKNVRFFDPVTHQKKHMNILLQNGIVRDFSSDISLTADRTIDLGGACVCPAFIDMDSSLCDPGQEYREDIVTGTRAAISGGYGALFSAVPSVTSYDELKTIEYMEKKANTRGFCKVFPIASVTAETDFEKLKSHHILAVGNDGSNASDEQIYRAMKRCKENDILFISASENPSFESTGVVNDGKVSDFLGLPGIPNAAESAETARMISLAASAGCRLHLSCISTKESVDIVRVAKSYGIAVSAATCPQYFSLTEDDVFFYGSAAKTLPPLRSKADTEAIIEGICDGTIDVISTRHRPCAEYEKKRPVSQAAFGMIGLQSAFAVSYTYLVAQGYIDIYRLINLLSSSAAKITGLISNGYGTLCIGTPISLCVFSTNKELILSRSNIQSKSFNTPYLGMSLLGTVDRIFLGDQYYRLGENS